MLLLFVEIRATAVAEWATAQKQNEAWKHSFQISLGFCAKMPTGLLSFFLHNDLLLSNSFDLAWPILFNDLIQHKNTSQRTTKEAAQHYAKTHNGPFLTLITISLWPLILTATFPSFIKSFINGIFLVNHKICESMENLEFLTEFERFPEVLQWLRFLPSHHGLVFLEISVSWESIIE